MNVLGTIVDPEIGINIVDLGLVYSVAIYQGHVHVTMTLTTPACPAGQYLSEQAEATIQRRLPDVRSASVEVVWDPPWSPEMMSEQAKQLLGWGRRS
jgi:metal-sulfur cluster biosynthetic enzyme